MYRSLFLLQWICLIILHSSSHASSAPSNRDAVTAQIDAFIEKILESDKFDLLADKIADRAAEKIKILQMRSIIRNGAEKGETEKDLEETKETTETPTTEKYRGKPGNIDMQAAMEKFATIPEEKLSLKYQNFINGNFKANNDLSEEPTTDKHRRTTRDTEMKRDKHYLENDETTKRNVNSETRVQHNKMYKASGQYQNKHVSDLSSSEKKPSKQSPKYNTDEEPPEKSVKPQNKDNSELIEYEIEMPSAEKEFKTSKDNKQNDDFSRIFRTNEKKSSKQDKKEKEVTVETDAETSEENHVSDDKEIVQVDDIYETTEIKDEKSEVTTNITVRREGGKLFALDPSPEYSEYHEKFAKSKKKLFKTNGIAVPTTLLPK